jgi:hypothetical protein
MKITPCVSFRTVDFMHEKFESYLLVVKMCPCFKVVLIFRCNLEHITKANWNRVTLPCVCVCGYCESLPEWQLCWVRAFFGWMEWWCIATWQLTCPHPFCFSLVWFCCIATTLDTFVLVVCFMLHSNAQGLCKWTKTSNHLCMAVHEPRY